MLRHHVAARDVSDHVRMTAATGRTIASAAASVLFVAALVAR
ncbi:MULTISPECIES: hypothetical protein [unclassified Afipia]|nr:MULTISPECIES: hypothetical protein [unclassified Afipia]